MAADRRWLATLDATFFSVRLARMNFLQWHHFCLERQVKGDVDLKNIQIIRTEPRYAFCHGGKDLAREEVYGNSAVRSEWESLCSQADLLIDRHKGTPWEMLIRKGMLLEWEIYEREKGRTVKAKRLKPSSSNTSTATPQGGGGTPTRPGRSGPGSSSASTTSTGGKP
jgi:hypothetical protein